MKVLFAAPARLWDAWSPALRNACSEMELCREGDPAGFDALIYAPGYPEDGTVLDFTPFTRARLVQSLWAGVERIVTNPTLTQPLCRMVDPGLAQGMVDYCAGWAMRAHLGMDRYAQDGIWRNHLTPPLARERGVTVLGMGELGRAVASALTGLGFRVTGWSQSGRPVPGIEALAGAALPEALRRAEVLICLLPDTPETRNLLDADRLALLPQGATVINAGRGTLIDERALLAALDQGRPGHAVLDVFRSEPLPPDHPFWAHPGVTVTPHVAAETRPVSAAPVVAENLRRAMRDEPLLHLVDRTRGY
ncbi:2-hydroxyacid dehydrogenase [Paracoccus denitrificans]|jgi:glyoxylate/hydroxypyruvate reductase A|uniref:D-isomer specific 2-hydroxyacid dehydrogenase, NAD-binding protein n=1 Tax=Paracoccus denitrificans (strain Pd 1222) TaxID=318586 RepID=A1B9A9_PARDP|nr:glyoxylate/hydroxypyruvate reductase A [Paracoccus denitrificans]ABL72103.1 D-isomer specific 2-hydroxyacid dehydrogenase, NAD-binding protein [Paracoccus denitrificans PD1222]MBB4625986.1 glyoxylate/hydroxypyruvate reductase A [Paracoccus denitrificans]MCU7426854.1 glyoxylate/hydroxypyruvate reductase A [Paracoccus denitrificans]QAR28680.1 glyoxylate/hydroxypyruvate reductase A [Paracoccus denitrificans]UPV96825.1 glyoxylate/hydroxypyruvate reductase A [Paracoccus denitrificans]